MARCVLMVMVTMWMVAGCGNDSSGGGSADASVQEVTCEQMCAHLLSEILDGCGKTSDMTECVMSCNENVTQGEVDQNGLKCAVEAGTCTAWSACCDCL